MKKELEKGAAETGIGLGSQRPKWDDLFISDPNFDFFDMKQHYNPSFDELLSYSNFNKAFKRMELLSSPLCLEYFSTLQTSFKLPELPDIRRFPAAQQ